MVHGAIHSAKNGSSSMALLTTRTRKIRRGIHLLLVVVFCVVILCSSSASPIRHSSRNKIKPPNPLWPAGISAHDVDRLVSEVTSDPTINIASIPDALERQIYSSTMQLCLNAIYRSLANVHGARLLGHEFQLSRWKGQDFRQHVYALLNSSRWGRSRGHVTRLGRRCLCFCGARSAIVPHALQPQYG